MGGAGAASMCVKIVVCYEQDVRFFIPLEPSAPASQAECPDDATAAQIAADYRAAVMVEAGMVDVKVLNTSCTWIVSGRGLLKGCCTLLDLQDEALNSGFNHPIREQHTTGQVSPLSC